MIVSQERRPSCWLNEYNWYCTRVKDGVMHESHVLSLGDEWIAMPLKWEAFIAPVQRWVQTAPPPVGFLGELL